jgi:von Willebrand factor type A domain
MRQRVRTDLARLGLGATLLSSGCGSTHVDPGFTRGAGEGSSGGAGATGPASGKSADGSAGSGSTSGGGTFPGSSAMEDAGAAGCATSNIPTMVEPAELVFMFDRSGSMGDSVGGGLTKWTAVAPALEGFFADPKSAGLSASLQFFAASDDECDAGAYAAPLVSMSRLPNGSAFASAIGATAPNGDTPTLPALTGALQYASQERAAHPGGHVAVVLVTDGEPHDDCKPRSSITNVVAAAQQYAASVPIYVIGVGKQLTSLNMIATAGGTGQAFLVATTNGLDAGATASQTEIDFVNALASIRSGQATCAVDIPTPPQGQTLDFNKVNVVLTSSGQPQTLGYNQGCEGDGGGAQGWSYDMPTRPTKIMLCADTCGAVQTDFTGEVTVQLGCTTVIR